jgi:hypothetical protein
MADRTYPRPDVDEAALHDALFGAGATPRSVGTGNADKIGLSIEGVSPDEVDAIYERALAALLAWRQAGDFISVEEGEERTREMIGRKRKVRGLGDAGRD